MGAIIPAIASLAGTGVPTALATTAITAGVTAAAMKHAIPDVPELAEDIGIGSAPTATTEQNKNVQAAGREAQLKALRRRGFMSTMKAGETGGFTTNKLGGS